MKKKMRAALSLTLAVIMCLSLSVGAFAETVSGTVEVETTAGNNETVDVTITIENTTNANGTTTTETTTEAEDFVTGDGMTVDYSANSTEIKDAEGNLLPGSNSDSSWNAVNGDGSYTSEGGSDSKVTENSPNVEVDVPTEAGKSNTVNGAAAGTTVTTGDTDKSDGIYDYTTETVLKQGSVTVGTTKVEVGVDKVESEYESDLKYKVNETDATKDNDLVDLNSKVEIPGEGDELPKAVEGYDFVYIGIDDTSQFWAAYLYTSPQLEGEVPVYYQKDEDGNVIQEYYIGRLGKNGKPYAAPKSYYIEGIYLDGQKVNND
ncbi:MAG: hypothetical protein IIX72_02115, partial [Oscillospiraceae bacterium]|nr:hypothetical protein [Oscillospiraceae bacterium]